MAGVQKIPAAFLNTGGEHMKFTTFGGTYGHKEMADDTLNDVQSHMTRAEEAIENWKRAQGVLDYLGKDGHSLDQQLVVACMAVSELAFKMDR